MDVAEREAFKQGFLQRCAEEGLTKEAFESRMEKAAVLPLAAVAPWLLAAGTSAMAAYPYVAGGAKAVGTGLAGLSAVAPLAGLVGGGALGYGAAKLTEPDTDPEQVKADEIANTYKVYAQRAAARKRLKSYRPTF